MLYIRLIQKVFLFNFLRNNINLRNLDFKYLLIWIKMKVESNLWSNDKESLSGLALPRLIRRTSEKKLSGRKIISNPIAARSNCDRDRSIRRATLKKSKKYASWCARALPYHERSLSIIRWTILNERTRWRGYTWRETARTRKGPCEGAVVRATRTSLHKIRAIFTAQPVRRTNQIWIQTSGGREHRTSWLRSNGYELLAPSAKNDPTRTSLTVEQWGPRVDWSWTELLDIARGREERRFEDRRGNFTEKLNGSTEFTRPRIYPFFRITSNGRIEGSLTFVILYLLKRWSARVRTSNWKTKVPGDLLARLRIRWQHKKFPKCWQPRFVTKSTTRCCPARLWPREYHGASSVGRTRGRP